MTCTRSLSVCARSNCAPPLLPAAHYSRGLAYSKKGELDRALGDLNQAVKLDPQRATGYLGRGVDFDTVDTVGGVA